MALTMEEFVQANNQVWQEVVKDMNTKYKIQCVSCCAVCHETTPLFNKDKMATGEMFTLKQEFKDHGWSGFPEYDNTSYPDIVCPSCGMCYCDSTGRIIRLQEDGEHEVTCKVVEEQVEEEGTEEKTDVFPEFTPGEDGKCQCPFCEKRLNKQWFARHIKQAHPNKV